ncbi:MAG TPA: helix-turn-helix domain-containing protein, partial [Sphingomonas sp.]|nr:helix-turn-helix domain-containing protein [Sphingomonas sp.]
MHNPVAFSELRQRTGMSIEELATELGYSASTIYRWERGEQEPKAAVYRALETIARFDPTPARDGDLHFRFIDLFAGIGGLRI